MLRGDACHTGVSCENESTVHDGIKWTFATGGRVLASPVLDRGTLFIGSDDGSLHAIDATTGKALWKFATGGPVRSTAVVDDGTVYFGSYDGQIYSISGDKGELRWKFRTGNGSRFESKGPSGFYLSNPVVAEGRVIFGSGDGQVYALETRTGALAWKFAVGEAVQASPAFADGRVFVGSWDSRLYALDVRTGRELWHFQAGLDPEDHTRVGFQSSPAVVDGVVYVGCPDARLYAIDAATGKEKWRFDNHGSRVVNSPAVVNGYVLFGISDTAKIHVVDAATGTLQPSMQLGSYIFALPTVADSVAYVGAMNGSLLVFDWEKGVALWEFQSAARENKLQVLNPDHSLCPETGFKNEFLEINVLSLERSFSIGPILSAPLVDSGVVYVGSTDGNVYALE